MRAAVVALALGAGGIARAEGVSALLQPGYTHAVVDTTEASGKTTHEVTDNLLQNYRLTLDKDLFPHLTLSLGGLFQDSRAWSDLDGARSFTDDRILGLLGRLNFATPVVSAGVGYDRRDEKASSSPSSLVTEVASAYAGWRPADLPALDARVDRAHNYDSAHQFIDQTVSTALLGARYTQQRYDLRYTLNWANPVDHLSKTELTSVDQSAQASYSDSFFNRRTTAYASVLVDDRTQSTTSQGTGGTVATQQHVIAGLSLVESFPAGPTNDTLTQNQLLTDGNTTASAGIDLGFSVTLGGDQNLRDLGGQFPDVVTPVNTVYVWVDKALPAEVVNPLAAGFTAYQSDDNQRWTPVQITRPPVFSPFQNRFEITIATTQARYLKVVTPALAPGVTTDRTFADIFVTEIQFYQVLPASSVPRQLHNLSGSFNGNARTLLVQRGNLSHDLSVQLNRQTNPSLTTYTVVNGLSAAQQLTRALAVNARAARQDLDAGHGHDVVWQWTAALLARPVPTLNSALSYSGQLDQTAGTSSQSLNLFSRADLYQGLSAQANVGASTATLARSQTSNGALANASLSAIPNRFLSLNAGWLYSVSTTSGGQQSSTVARFQRADASASFTPTQALSLSGSVARIIQGPKPATLASVQLAYSPLRGDLQLAFSYSKAIDQVAETIIQTWGPTLRWTIRPGVRLDAGYSVLDLDTNLLTQHTTVLSTNLLVSL